MKNTWKILVLALVLAAFLLTGCTGSPIGTNWPGLAAAGNTVYLSNMNNIYAIQTSESSGTLMWKFPQEASKVMFFAPATIAGDSQVIVGDYTKTLYSVNPKNGNTNWIFTQAEGRYIGAALVTADGIYAPNADYSLYALNLDGSLKWKYTSGQAIWATPVSDGTLIYFNSLDHYAYALNASDGSLVWKTDLKGPMVSAPALADGKLYIGMLDNGVYALDAATGANLWKTDTEDGVYGTPIVQQGKVYTADLSGNIYSLFADTGSLDWKIKPGGSIASSPVIIDSNIVFTTEKSEVIAVDSTGTVAWMRTISGTLNSTPTVANGVVVVAAYQGDNLLTAFNGAGTQLWVYNPPKN